MSMSLALAYQTSYNKMLFSDGDVFGRALGASATALACSDLLT